MTYKPRQKKALRKHLNDRPSCWWIATALVFLSIGVHGSAYADDISAGRALAETHCARCHAIGKTGSSKHAEAPVFREVVSRYPPASLAEALAEGISTGHPDMPEFVFSPDDIGNLIAFLESLQ